TLHQGDTPYQSALDAMNAPGLAYDIPFTVDAMNAAGLAYDIPFTVETEFNADGTGITRVILELSGPAAAPGEAESPLGSHPVGAEPARPAGERAVRDPERWRQLRFAGDSFVRAVLVELGLPIGEDPGPDFPDWLRMELLTRCRLTQNVALP